MGEGGEMSKDRFIYYNNILEADSEYDELIKFIKSDIVKIEINTLSNLPKRKSSFWIRLWKRITKLAVK